MWRFAANNYDHSMAIINQLFHLLLKFIGDIHWGDSNQVPTEPCVQIVIPKLFCYYLSISALCEAD